MVKLWLSRAGVDALLGGNASGRVQRLYIYYVTLLAVSLGININFILV